MFCIIEGFSFESCRDDFYNESQVDKIQGGKSNLKFMEYVGEFDFKIGNEELDFSIV